MVIRKFTCGSYLFFHLYFTNRKWYCKVSYICRFTDYVGSHRGRGRLLVHTSITPNVV